MKTQNNTHCKKNRPVTEWLVLLSGLVWVCFTGWLFQLSPVPEPPLPPPEVSRFLAHVRTCSLPGWAFSLLPLLCLWMDYDTCGKLPTLTGWLRRYGLIVTAGLGIALWVFIRRGAPEVVKDYNLFSWILLWTIFCTLCIFRKAAE